MIDTDLTSTFITISAFVLSMVKRGRGSIITMSSSAGRQPARSNAAYAAAQAGVVAFTRHLANEIAPNGVRVNCLAASSIETERLHAWTTPELRHQLAQSFSLRRIGRANPPLRHRSRCDRRISTVPMSVIAATSRRD